MNFGNFYTPYYSSLVKHHQTTKSTFAINELLGFNENNSDKTIHQIETTSCNNSNLSVSNSNIEDDDSNDCITNRNNVNRSLVDKKRKRKSRRHRLVIQ